MDQPEMILEGALENHYKMIKQMKGQSMKLGEIEAMWKFFDARLASF